MRRLMHLSVECYRRRHGGRMPRRITVHKTTPFKEAEVDGCFDAFAAVEDVRLLTVQQDTLWRGMQVGAKGEQMVADGYPCYRGTSLPLGAYESLVWTQGNVKSVLRVDSDYYKEGKGIPSPILLARYAGHGDMAEDVEDVLGLTMMDWNNDSLYNRLPVTMSYASVLANTVKRMPTLKKSPYSLRLFMEKRSLAVAKFALLTKRLSLWGAPASCDRYSVIVQKAASQVQRGEAFRLRYAGS